MQNQERSTKCAAAREPAANVSEGAESHQSSNPPRESPRVAAQRRLIENCRPAQGLSPKTTAGDGVAQREVRQVNLSDLQAVIEAMSSRAQDDAATLAMIADFATAKPGCTYYLATNDKHGQEARYGMMSLKIAPPGVTDPGAAQPGYRNPVDNSVWVEGLVSDKGSGLGPILLQCAEEVARREGKALSLAAYEDSFDGKPYSAAAYYQGKIGMQYSGDAVVEKDDEGGTKTHPIYYKYPAMKANL